MASFRKKLPTIEAHQWGMQNDASLPHWLRDVVLHEWPMLRRDRHGNTLGRGLAGHVIRDGETLCVGMPNDRTMKARPGDWIVRDPEVGLFVVDLGEFPAAYEPAS